MQDWDMLTEEDLMQKICTGEIIVTSESNGDELDIYENEDGEPVFELGTRSIWNIMTIEHAEDNLFELYCKMATPVYDDNDEVVEEITKEKEIRVILSWAI